MGQMVSIAEAIARSGSSPSARLREAVERYQAMTPEERAALEEEERRAEMRSGYESRRRLARERSGLTGEMWEQTLESFPVQHPSQAEAVTLARQFAAHFPGTPDKPTRRGLYLWGEHGRGKSGIMNGLVIALLSKPRIHDVLMVPLGDPAELARMQADMDLATAARDMDVLILDDWDKAMDKPGARFRSEPEKFIRGIINYAARTRRLIICATGNHSIAEGSEADRRWPSITSRMRGLMRGLNDDKPVEGPDMRPDIDDAHEDLWWVD